MTEPKIELTTLNDLPGLQAVLDGTALFPSEMLPEMIAPFLSGETGMKKKRVFAISGPKVMTRSPSEKRSEKMSFSLLHGLDSEAFRSKKEAARGRPLITSGWKA